MFGIHSVCRCEVLGTIFQVMNGTNDLEVQYVYCSILEQIASQHLGLLVSYTHKIQDWFAYLQCFLLEMGVRITNALLPLVNHSPSFFDHIYIVLQKLLVCRNNQSRIIAINGLCSLLRHQQEEKIEREIILTLKPSFGLSLEIRKHIYGAVARIL